MSMADYLTWSGPLQALIVVVVNVVVIAALAIWIWALGIRGQGSAHQ